MDFIKRHKWEVPLYIIAAGLPLIIYFHVQYTGMEGLPWFPNQVTWTDFFLYGKSKCVHFTALLMGILLVIDAVRKKNEKFEREWILIIFLGAVQLFSAFCSISVQQSFLGGIEQYESVWVLTGYLIIGTYAYQMTLKSEKPEYIVYALFAGVFFSSLLGITQILQMDFWESEIGKSLLVPESYRELRESLRFNFSQGNMQPVYLASYNPNYAGIYLLMILPCMILCKNRYVRLMTIFTGICLIGTMSKTVLFAAVITLIFAMILFRKAVDEKWKRRSKIVGVLLLIFSVLFAFYEKKAGAFGFENKLQSVKCEEDYVKIVYQGETILMRDKIAYQGGVTYEILYEDGNRIKLAWNEASGEMDPLEEALQGLHFKVYEKDGISYIMFRYKDIPFRFTKDTGTGKYEYVSINGKIDELHDAKAAFSGMEDLLSGRGYIWSRTIPLIFERPLFGTGPDTFLLTFPQDDYIVRSNLGHTFFTQLLTNAHSFYLQMAEQTGVLSVLCFLVFVGVYLGKSWKLYYGKAEYRTQQKMGSGIFLGVIGYLFCGLTFASSVCTTPIFWLLLGTGIGINKIVAENKNQHLSE